MGLEIVIILALVLVNGLFAGSEIAVLSVRGADVRERASRRDRGALAVESLRAEPERFLATVQIGITVVGAGAAAFGGASLADDLAPSIAALGLVTWADEIAFGVVIALLSWLSLVFGELVPKSLALRYAGGYAFAIAPWLLRLSRWFRPLVWFLTACSNVVLRPFGDRTNFTESRVSRDELRQLVEEAARAGSVDPQTSTMAARAIAFEDVRVAELMVARGDVVALDVRAPLDEVKRIITEEGHARMPVYRDDPRQVIGYVVARDLLAMAWDQQLLVLADLVRPVFVAPATARAIDVLRELQRRRVQLAIVADEHGSWLGIVTIEDLIEEVVGDIFSEDDDADVIARNADGTADVPATVQVRRVNRVLGVELPTGTDRTTIGGVCLNLAHGIPAPGTRLTAEDGTVLEVLDATPRRIRTVRIHPAPRAEAPAPDEAAP